MKNLVNGLLLAAMLLIATSAQAELKLPALVGDGMVLQRDTATRVWGWADSGAKVVVSVDGKTATAIAADDGKWIATLPAHAAGGPFDLSIQTSVGDETTVKNVLFGEVWVCSGQSNMQWTVQQSLNPQEEIAAADYPHIRLFSVPRKTAAWAQEDVEANWQVCSPQTVAGFSAVAYYFGRDLHKKLKVPIGLINTSYGGTPSEAWTSRSSLVGTGKLEPLLSRWDASVAGFDEEQAKAQHEAQLAQWQERAAAARAAGNNPPRRPQLARSPASHPHRPGSLYNAMIAPLVKYRVAGAIWYQGESNVGRAADYNIVFPNMIANWRQVWGQPEMPFYFVQIAPYNYGANNVACAELWEAQLHAMRKVPNTGMVTTMDVGNLRDIHPKNKQDVGKRLAAWARAKVYGESDLPYSGPIYKSAKFEADKAIITFDYATGLKTSDGEEPTHFTIAGSDGAFHPAKAEIVGGNVVVTSEQVSAPMAVRFAWSGIAEPNLVNGHGLPAAPFRTDDLPLTTQGNH